MLLYHPPFPFIPPNEAIKPLLALFTVHGLLFFISCCHVHLRMDIYTYIPKYNLLGLYNATCKHVFRADHTVLDNQSVHSFLGETCALSISWLPVVVFPLFTSAMPIVAVLVKIMFK